MSQHGNEPDLCLILSPVVQSHFSCTVLFKIVSHLYLMVDCLSDFFSRMREMLPVLSGNKHSFAAFRGRLLVRSSLGRLVEMSCEDHDRLAASSQFLAHVLGRVFLKIGLEATAIDTKGYRSLLGLLTHTSFNSDALFQGL